MNLILAAGECPEEIGRTNNCFPEELPLQDLFIFDPIFGEGLLAFNRTSGLYILAALIVIGLMFAAFRKPKLVPGRFQNAMEGLMEIVRNNIILGTIGPDGLKFLPLLGTMFLFIFVNNFFEITPFVNFPSTGRMAMPAFLALMVLVVFILVGLKAQGPKYFINAVKPSGVPWWVLLLVIPIEIVSTFIVRPLTLSVRLFANMMAGHILLATAFIAANAFFIDFHVLLDGMAPTLASWQALPVGLAAIVGSVLLVLFELLVSFLQAYIFTILTAVYIGGALHPSH